MTSEIKNLQYEIPKALRFPFDLPNILRKRQSLRKELLKQVNLIPTRIGILGGSTTSEVRSMLELFLLAQGIQPAFYESGYNRYYEDVFLESPDLWNLKPDVVFIHTTWHNVSQFPELLQGEAQVEDLVRREMVKFESLWGKIHTGLGSLIIQNNFDLPRLRPLGNLEAFESFGRVNFLQRLNAEFASYARNHSRFLINDIHYLSAQVGLATWFDHTYWYNFHMALSPTATVALAHNVAAIVKSVYGKSKKCLILDLDNTLWGGVIGDDGVQNLILGRDNPIGESFVNFQQYVKDLQRRGVILAVCSKNDLENAREGFSHPDSVLKLEDFSAFKANWNPKPENIREIATELNIGLDSIVFVDDNPVERALIAEQMPDVAVPDVGSEVSYFAEILEQERYFEVNKIVQDDLGRSAYYSLNAQRNACRAEFGVYEEFLASLEMKAEIGAFCPVYLERITQLINKTNQFNLTTKRYTMAEVDSVTCDPAFVTLYGRLADRFGDNGLVSALIGCVSDDKVELDVWVMSCRVIKREMEIAMFDALVEECQARGIRKIVGAYIPSKKNGIVVGFYASLGFSRIDGTFDGRELWQYDLPQNYSVRTRYVRRIAAAPLKQANVDGAVAPSRV